MSGTYYITITLGSTLIFKGYFIVDILQLPNITAFYEDGNPANILAPIGSWRNNDNAFISKTTPFSPNGCSITTMSYYPGNYGSNTTDNTYNFFGKYDSAIPTGLITQIANFDSNNYVFTITGGPLVPPFPRDTSTPPPCFYNIQGLSMYLNQNKLYKIYYQDPPSPFIYLNINIPFYYSDINPLAANYNPQNVPLSPLLSNLSQSQAREYESQITLFRKVYEYNYNAYINYISQISGCTTGPYYYTFSNYKELNNYKAGLQLVNRIYPFNVMARAEDRNTGVPLRWIVPFPL